MKDATTPMKVGELRFEKVEKGLDCEYSKAEERDK